jgi:hypothetical protein
MEFALFYEIPVARPWTPGKEHEDTMRAIELIGKHVIPEFQD